MDACGRRRAARRENRFFVLAPPSSWSCPDSLAIKMKRTYGQTSGSTPSSGQPAATQPYQATSTSGQPALPPLPPGPPPPPPSSAPNPYQTAATYNYAAYAQVAAPAAGAQQAAAHPQYPGYGYGQVRPLSCS